MQKDKWHPGFSGEIKYWYLNHGEGAFRQDNFGELESDDVLYGFRLGVEDSKPSKGWEHKELTECVFSDEKTPIEIELKEADDNQINGITEYGYGFWSRWLWNGPTSKMVTKPVWTGLSRLTIYENYEGDARSLGDRTLAIWVGAGYYHFTTYGIAPANVNFWNNVDYQVQLDG